MIARALPLIALAAMAVAAWMIHAHPEEALASGPGCAIQRVTGLHCPGCGSTRAAAHLADGDLKAALGSNAMVLVTIPLILIVLLGATLRSWTSLRLPPLPRPRILWICLVVAVLLFTVLRNLPVAPFSSLAP